MDDAFAGATNNEIVNSTVSAGSHEDGVHMEVVGLLQNGLGGWALDQQGGGIEAVFTKFNGGGFHLVVFAVEFLGHGVADGVGSGFVANEVGVGLGYVQEEQLGGQAVGPATGFA